MSNLPTRRGFLALTGTGTAASLAGCSQLESIAQDGSGDGAVTVTVQPDREELTSLQEEIQEDAESENLSQREAQRAYQERQRELVEETATDFEDAAGENDLTIEAAETEYGLFRVTGSDDAIMGALRNGEVSGIYPGEQYELFLQQQQQREQQQELLEQQQQAGNETPSGNETGAENESVAENESPSGNETASGNETDG